MKLYAVLTRSPDPSFTIDFLLTYRSFTTPRELLTLLSARFSLEPPLGTSSVDEWRKNTLTPIRLKYKRRTRCVFPLYLHLCLCSYMFFCLCASVPFCHSTFVFSSHFCLLRVAAVLKNWLSNHWHDFEADDALTAATLSFLELMAREGMRSSADALRNVIERKVLRREWRHIEGFVCQLADRDRENNMGKSKHFKKEYISSTLLIAETRQRRWQQQRGPQAVLCASARARTHSGASLVHEHQRTNQSHKYQCRAGASANRSRPLRGME